MTQFAICLALDMYGCILSLGSPRMTLHNGAGYVSNTLMTSKCYIFAIKLLYILTQVLVTVNTTYQTSFGNRSFTTSSEVDTKKNHETFPLYNPFATYTITVLAATRSQQCLGERIVVSDLPGREGMYRMRRHVC